MSAAAVNEGLQSVLIIVFSLLLIPTGLKIAEQLRFVLEKLKLDVREPRCMACGGMLTSVAKENVRAKVPARTFDWLDDFYQCQRCQRVFWQGTHWQRISERLRDVKPGR